MKEVGAATAAWLGDLAAEVVGAIPEPSRAQIELDEVKVNLARDLSLHSTRSDDARSAEKGPPVQRTESVQAAQLAVSVVAASSPAAFGNW